MKKALFLISIIALAAGCVTKPPAVTTVDSVYIESVKEVPVYIPGDTVMVDVPINCPDQSIAEVEFSKLRQQLSILHGRLVSRTIVKPDTIKVPVTEIKEKIVEKEVRIPEPVRYVPKIHKIALWGWIILLAAGSGVLLLKANKLKFLNLFKR